MFDVDTWAPDDVAADDPWRPTRAHEAWRAARAAWVEAGGVWPDEDQREFEEAFAAPDEPFCGCFRDDCQGGHCPHRQTQRDIGCDGATSTNAEVVE